MDQVFSPLGLYFMAAAAFAGAMVSLTTGRFLTPDAFLGRNYSLALNMIGHLVIGAVLLAGICWGWAMLTGEFPEREHALAACIVGPIAFEIAQYCRFQGAWWDHVEDAAIMMAQPIAFVWGGWVWVDGVVAQGPVSYPLAAVALLAMWWRARTWLAR